MLTKDLTTMVFWLRSVPWLDLVGLVGVGLVGVGLVGVGLVGVGLWVSVLWVLASISLLVS
ncbi:hypothetical protein N7504_006264 [Penicillium tannophilum]|nr:hypothetical protein N7504_006264 [Penicillium tannophilum]